MTEKMMGRFVEVPPPAKAPIEKSAGKYNLLPSLKAETSDHQFRCDNCNRMQPLGSVMVWVPDGTMPWDPDWSVTERCRLNAYNGNASGWCLNCAKKLGNKGIIPKFWAAIKIFWS